MSGRFPSLCQKDTVHSEPNQSPAEGVSQTSADAAPTAHTEETTDLRENQSPGKEPQEAGQMLTQDQESFSEKLQEGLQVQPQKDAA